MQPILRKFRLLLSQLRGKFSPSCRVDYINGSDTFPPPLCKEEEQAVFARLHQGDTAARETLIVHNLRLVVYIAKKFESSGLGLEDLISIGTIGLIKAVETFCPDKKIKLATYASRCIENEILMVLRKNAQLRGEISIDEPLSSDWDGNELLLSDILGTDEDIVSRDIENEAEREMLLAAVSELGEREQEIMQMRFGLCGKKEAHPKGSRRGDRHFAVLHLPAGKKDHPQTAKKAGRGRPAHCSTLPETRKRAAGHHALRLSFL